MTASCRRGTGRAGSGRRPPRRHDLHERLAADLVEGEPGGERLLLGDRAAGDAAQEVVEQALAGRGVVEHVADQGGLRRLVDEVLEALRGGREAIEEEAVDGTVARGQLSGMEIP